jgi:SOS-response transcriptional repressor LexA
MHPFQEKLLILLGKKLKMNYKNGLRSLGRIVGTENPQNIKHHLEQLEKKKRIFINKNTGEVVLLMPERNKLSRFFDLPILGYASCSPDGLLADQNIEGYLKISQSAIDAKNHDVLFVIKVVGDSMNQAKEVRGGTIESGDYVIINPGRNPKNGDYVLSIIDEAANIKRFYRDLVNKEVRLVSESSIDFPPIILSENDLKEKNYFINGVVERVIKN